MYLYTLQEESFMVAMVYCKRTGDGHSNTSNGSHFPDWEITQAQRFEWMNKIVEEKTYSPWLKSRSVIPLSKLSSLLTTFLTAYLSSFFQTFYFCSCAHVPSLSAQPSSRDSFFSSHVSLLIWLFSSILSSCLAILHLLTWCLLFATASLHCPDILSVGGHMPLVRWDACPNVSLNFLAWLILMIRTGSTYWRLLTCLLLKQLIPYWKHRLALFWHCSMHWL